MFTLSFVRVILLLVICLEAQCSANIRCYTCAWLKSGSETNEKADFCRPGRLDTKNVQIESCSRGCFTTIIYEYDPDKAEELGFLGLKNCTDDSNTLLEVSNMTLFARKCSEKSFINDHCLIRSVRGFHAEEHFCRTNYCNGESGSESLSSTVLWTGLSFLLSVALSTSQPPLNFYK